MTHTTQNEEIKTIISSKINNLVESYAAGEKGLKKLNDILELIDAQENPTKFKEISNKVRDIENGNQYAVKQLSQEMKTSEYSIIEGLSAYIDRGCNTLNDFYKNVRINQVKNQQNNELSNCCNTPVKVDCGGEGTCCWICTTCNKPCDVHQPPVLEFDESLPTVIICDIDGTIALFGDKNPYERDFENDIPNEPIVKLIKTMNGTVDRVVFFSGRKGSAYQKTYTWISEKVFNGNEKWDLYMRNTGDVRKDFIIKREMYEEHVKGKYNVLFVIDDRNQVVELWRSIGLTCLQVAEGNF